MKKRKVVKIIAIVIAVLLAVGMLGAPIYYILAADESEKVADTATSVVESATSVKEVPLLILLVSFDADGDGINDWDSAHPNRLWVDQGAKYYGEQWAGTSAADHYDTYFGHNCGSLCDYFSEMSSGRFTYVPAKFDKFEESWDIRDGIISVTLNAAHPTSYFVANGYVNSTTFLNYCSNLVFRAIDSVDQYIDFSKFDSSKDGKLTPDELGLLMLVSGGDRSTSSPAAYTMESVPRFYFQTHAASIAVTSVVDNVKIAPKGSCNVSCVGEFYSEGKIMNVGTAAHELAHTLGAQDLYSTGTALGGDSSADPQWPQPYNFSLECDGSHLNSSKTPSYLDPYQRIKLGFDSVTTAGEDGTYTLHSTKSGQYSILKVTTPDPNEYYLIEIRLKEGFDTYLSSGSSAGGIIVWHIDEDINNKYYTDGYSCTPVAVDGAVHDPGIVPLFRTGWNDIGNRMINTTPEDPFFYLSEDASTASFDSMNYCSATKSVLSLNSYPDKWEKGTAFNLHMDVLSKPGSEMKISIKREIKKIAPVLSCTLTEKTTTTLSVVCSVDRIYDEAVTECGVIISAKENPSSTNGMMYLCLEDGDMNFANVFSRLDPGTAYYIVAYAKTASGISYSETVKCQTLPIRDYFVYYLYRNITAGEKAMEAEGKPGQVLSYKFEMKKPGYTFAGWYTDAALTNVYDMASVRKDTSSDVTLYAKWVESATTETTTAETTAVVTTAETTTEMTTAETTAVVTTAETTASEVTTSTVATEATTETVSAVTTSTVSTTETEEQTSSSPFETTETEEHRASGERLVILILGIAVVVLGTAFVISLVLVRRKR